MEEKNKNKNIDFEKITTHTLTRTKFLISVAYLLGQVIIPALVLFFVTGTDFSFTFKLSLWAMIVCTIGLILLAFALTYVGYKMRLHHIDQFTYTIPFAFLLGIFYLAGYFLNPQQLLIRFIIALGAAVIGILLTSILLLLVLRKKHIQSYRAN